MSARRDRSPVFWLKSQFDAAKNIPEPVRRHVDQLFKQRRLFKIPEEQARREAMQLACRINWARTQHALLSTEPSDTKFWTLSKVACTWMALDGKLNKRNSIGRNGEQAKKKMPTAAIRQAESDDDEAVDADAESPEE